MKSWSTMQAVVAMSSAEAELYALVKTAGEALGVKALLEDLGWETHVKIFLDSSAAKSIASRTGLGRVRHVDVKYLWVQEAVKTGKIMVAKIFGTDNPADALTKPLMMREIRDRGLLAAIGGEVVRRRWADVGDV